MDAVRKGLRPSELPASARIQGSCAIHGSISGVRSYTVGLRAEGTPGLHRPGAATIRTTLGLSLAGAFVPDGDAGNGGPTPSASAGTTSGTGNVNAPSRRGVHIFCGVGERRVGGRRRAPVGALGFARRFGTQSLSPVTSHSPLSILHSPFSPQRSTPRRWATGRAGIHGRRSDRLGVLIGSIRGRRPRPRAGGRHPHRRRCRHR